MRHDSTHPSDETLLRAIDAELSQRRNTVLDRHLQRCEPCRLRLVAIQSAADEASRLYLGAVRPNRPDPGALRARLQADMGRLATAWERSLWFRVRRGMATRPYVARAWLSLAVMVLALQVLQQAQDTALSSSSIGPVARPIRALTPGATDTVDRQTLCAGGVPVRTAIPLPIRQRVLRLYRLEHLAVEDYELDYLITPELGGATDLRNLWPERYASGVWNAHVKDELEALLPQLVCEGTLALATAQHEIATDWIAAYKKYFRTDRPIPGQTGQFDNDDDADDDRHIQSPGTLARATWARALPVRSFRVSFVTTRGSSALYDSQYSDLDR